MPPKKKNASLAGLAKSVADPKAKKKAAKNVAAKLKKKAKASSTKELTADGAKVVTVAEGVDATAAPPPEPVAPEPVEPVEPERAPTPEPRGPPPLPDPSDALAYARAVWADDCPHALTKSEIKVHYSHYKTAFPTRNGVVRWPSIDDEYAISFIFKGDFAKRVRAFPPGVTSANAEEAPLLVMAVGHEGVDDFGDRNASLDEVYWLGLREDFEGKYTLEVDEDVEAGLGVATREGPLVLSSGDNLPLGARKTEGCSCLFGNPCQDKYVCKDWNNRFEVAKRNS